MNIYNKLQTKPININKTKNENILNIIKKCLIKCYNNYAFSTLTYTVDNYNSEQSITNLNSGDCVALSLFIKHELKNNYNIDSCLIPASIPNMFKQSGYLYLSHVAVIIPLNTKFYIVDPAFYFTEPIVFDPYDLYKKQTIKNTDIYSGSIDTVITRFDYLKNDKIYNNYQSLPKYTPFANCYYQHNTSDNWHYYIREIINPDNAITNFFININKNCRFITITKLSDNCQCYLHIFLKIYLDTNILSLKIDDKYYFNDNIRNLTYENIQFINNLLKLYINGSIERYFKNNNEPINIYD